VNEGKMSMTGLQQVVARLEAQRSSWLEVAPSDRLEIWLRRCRSSTAARLGFVSTGSGVGLVS
jgi:hypothetical protein